MNGPTNKYSERGSLKIFIMLTELITIFPSYSVFVVQLLNSYSDRFSIKRNWKAASVMTSILLCYIQLKLFIYRGDYGWILGEILEFLAHI